MGDFEVSQKIQKMVFPKGVKWDKENRAYLTDFGNLFFALIFSVSDNYKNEIAQKKEKHFRFSFLSSGGRTRTCGLRVMSPTSCQLLYPAMYLYVSRGPTFRG